MLLKGFSFLRSVVLQPETFEAKFLQRRRHLGSGGAAVQFESEDPYEALANARVEGLKVDAVGRIGVGPPVVGVFEALGQAKVAVYHFVDEGPPHVFPSREAAMHAADPAGFQWSCEDLGGVHLDLEGVFACDLA